MASRFTEKPDPSIKKNVLRARAAAHNAKRAHASVVVVSVVATLLAWATFSDQDTQATEAAARAANSSQAALIITAPAQSADNPQASANQVPRAVALMRSSR